MERQLRESFCRQRGSRADDCLIVRAVLSSVRPSPIFAQLSLISLIDYLTHTYTTNHREFSLADNYWSHYSEGSLMLFLQMALVFVISGQQAPWFVKPVITGFVNTVKVGCLGRDGESG
jgi:hypothetical protein